MNKSPTLDTTVVYDGLWEIMCEVFWDGGHMTFIYFIS